MVRLISGMRMVGTNKSLGQHWLKNRAILEEIAELVAGSGLVGDSGDYTANSSASLSSAKTEVEACLEIGPGLGTLTSSLLRRFKKVIAVEFDKRLADNLPKSFPGKNLEVINGDILDFDFSLIPRPYVVAGNIPYYITSPIIEKLLTAENLAERIVLLIQKEVAERITSDKETMLSLFVKNRAEVFPGPVVLKGEFTPPPKVDSQVIILEPLKKLRVADEVFKLIRVGFSSPRKKLVHNLASIKSKEEVGEIFRESGISLDSRPGDLNLEDWEKLYNKIYK